MNQEQFPTQLELYIKMIQKADASPIATVIWS